MDWDDVIIWVRLRYQHCMIVKSGTEGELATKQSSLIMSMTDLSSYCPNLPQPAQRPSRLHDHALKLVSSCFLPNPYIDEEHVVWRIGLIGAFEYEVVF